MAAEEQARCLRALEQATSVGTAARSSILGAFTAGQGYAVDADYSPRAWRIMIHQTRISKGAAVAHTAWARRAAAHPQVAQVLATGEMSESFARAICTWTDKLSADCREAADAILLAAARAGGDLRDLRRGWRRKSCPGPCPRTRTRTRRSRTGPCGWRLRSTAPGSWRVT